MSFRGSGWLACDGDGCHNQFCSVLSRGEAGARASARQGGWTTARGRDLCEACTAKRNEAARAAAGA